MNSLIKWLRRLLLAGLLLGMAAYAILFTLQNKAKLDVDFIFVQQTDVPVELLIILSFLAGGLIGIIADLFWRLRLKSKLNKAELELSKHQ